MGHRSTDAVPLCSLVSEHAEVGIQHVVYHVIRGRHVETIAEPVHCQVSRHHGIEEKILQVLQGLGIGEECFVHVYTIHDLGCCACFVCHLGNWSEAADQFVLLSREMVAYSITEQLFQLTNILFWQL